MSTTKMTPKQIAFTFFLAAALGYTFEWSDDWSIGDHQKEFDCYENGGPETCESCICRDANGIVVSSLTCINDATRAYRRVVEAELASEALAA